MEENKPLVISIDQLCHMLQIGKNIAYKLLASGDIPAFKIGRIWKIPHDSISQYISNYKTFRD